VRAAGRGAVLLAMMLLAACAALPPQPPELRPPQSGPAASPPASSYAPPRDLPPDSAAAALGARVVGVAESVIGAPYRFGGAAREGFDCSGLVYFAHAAVGLHIPRTVAAQSAAARPVTAAALAPGDLVFFHLGGAVIDHVGIYAGAGRFIHAPSRGRVVSYAWLSDPYYARRYVGAGRFWPASSMAPVAAASAAPGAGRDAHTQAVSGLPRG
jgi:cell wall-associated NlpC family hydrolase